MFTPGIRPLWIAACWLGGLGLTGVAAVMAADAVAGATAGTDTAAPKPDAIAFDSTEAAAAILDPTQGRPIVIQAGEQFRFLLRLGPGVEGDVRLALRHSRVASLRQPLSLVGKMTIFQQRYASMALKTAPNVPPGLYDLVLKSEAAEIVAPHSVKVVEHFVPRFRFVHLSDMTIDDPSAPAFDDRLVEEVNLLAPEFIVATGDYTAWGRALDDPDTWKRALKYLARFDAPVFMVCGDEDHETSFTRHIAQSPIGTFDYGPYHGLLLLNHASHPIDQDQIDFVSRDLGSHTQGAFNMLVCHSDDPGWLERLSPRDALDRYLISHKVKLLVTGGSDDWDGVEHAAKLSGLSSLHYIRTHQASTCLRGRATGVSHYRVFEVDGDKVSFVYPDDMGPKGHQHSIPVGRLRVFAESEGSSRVGLTIQNALNQAFEGARAWVKVAKSGSAEPQIAGGRLAQILDAGEHWMCQVEADLPDKGGVRLLVATEGTLPEAVPVKAEYVGETDLTFTQERTKDGLVYFKSEQAVQIKLKNTSQRSLRAFPTLRLNGNLLPIFAADGAAVPLEIAPAGEAELAAGLLLAKVSEGPHLMQLVFLEDEIRRVTSFPVTLKLKQGTTPIASGPR